MSVTDAAPTETMAPGGQGQLVPALPTAGPRRLYAWITQTITSGMTPSYRTRGSPTCTQASRTDTRTGTHQCGRARSRINQITTIATWVPVWSALDSSVALAVPSDGASMIPAATSIRTAPSRPAACPLASSAAPSTSSV